MDASLIVVACMRQDIVLLFDQDDFLATIRKKQCDAAPVKTGTNDNVYDIIHIGLTGPLTLG
jgi:hypothetical protein